MNWLDGFIIILLLIALSFGTYFLWLNLPSESIEFEQYKANITKSYPIQSTQFYSNLRFKDKEITYHIENSCDEKKVNDSKEAFNIIQQNTILSFTESPSPDILILCSDIAPEPEQENHFVAGEGGPTEIINATNFAIILESKVSLYRPDKCDKPQIAIHEILHALGFDHNSNKSSIMNPITDCEQVIDQYIFNEIEKVYSTPSFPDLTIESIEASKSGRNLNFVAVITNNGLKDVNDASLNIIADNELIKSFDIKELEIGSKRKLSVENLNIPRKVEKITFIVETSSPEISKDNNQAEIKIARTD
jgi:hypothetical protein